jgi:hypothetical protein
VSKPPKTIRPPEGPEPLAAWLRTLLTRERELSGAERTAITDLGQVAVPELVAILRKAPRRGRPPCAPRVSSLGFGPRKPSIR